MNEESAGKDLDRRGFLGGMGMGSLGALVAGGMSATELREKLRPWNPLSDRKIKVGIVGYGVCKFGAKFGFQDHPNVEIVAVSDLVPERRKGLMEAATSISDGQLLLQAGNHSFDQRQLIQHEQLATIAS